jgi:hypothetical protein
VNTVRETVFGAVYFGVYEATKKLLKENLPNVISGSYSSLLAIQLAGRRFALKKKELSYFRRFIFVLFSSSFRWLLGNGSVVRELPARCGEIKHPSRAPGTISLSKMNANFQSIDFIVMNIKDFWCD